MGAAVVGSGGGGGGSVGGGGVGGFGGAPPGHMYIVYQYRWICLHSPPGQLFWQSFTLLYSRPKS